MTDRDPIAAALEDLRAKEDAQRAAHRGVEEALFTVEVEQARERVPAPLYVLDEEEVTLPDGERYDAAMERNGVVEDPAAQTLYERMNPHDGTYPGRRVHVALLRLPFGQQLDFTYKRIREMLADADLKPAGIREIAEVAGTSRGAFTEGDVIVGFGQVLWDHRYPVLKFEDGAMRQKLVTPSDYISTSPSVTFIPVIFAERATQKGEAKPTTP